MTDPGGPADGPPLDASPAPMAVRPTGLADGEWHRLHPATPLLRGGIGLVALIGVLIANLRERILGFFVDDPGFQSEGDPIDFVVQEGLVGLALLAVLVILLLSVLGFYLSWRFHTFRVTQEVVEVRSGIVFRTNRKARLDRVQGININRPFFARLFGTAKLEITQAGQDANVQLSYLATGQADDLRREILRLASGAVEQSSAGVAGLPEEARRSVLEKRVSELLAPELDPKLAASESVVKINPGRLAGSIVLSESTLIFVVLIIAAIVLVAVTGELVAIFGIFPGIIGLGGYLVSRFTKSLRYSIASTPDGVRVGFGLLSTSNDTLPPGRIHSVSISQSILWRPAGWWQIKVNRASRSANSSQQQQRSVLLPVGDLDEAMRVLELLLPGLQRVDLLREGLVSRGGAGDGFVNSPRRAVWLRWFSRRRNGFAILPDAVVLRRGAIWRELVLVPLPRLQSVAITQGPLVRALDLAAVHLHTVAGPISGRLGAVDRQAALGFFSDVATAAIESAQSDTSHRWRSRESVS
ncbi:PH domain-containing protein [Lysobacter korlensis]|uniref:PH domain-containing protein n=1 Tax=Lysobacter korlensis TaxID=553636 RepID=A0ABV6RXD4_9GAMM